ncbi:hypothetical protein AL755_14580 [Arthrobacter sp. ERGS1:01]|nr:hypothetical protein AL755_14580 [Arthrobacter sp. ERGS1:01]
MRQDIQAVALRLFQQQGYEATTMEQVADAALVSASTLYRHFPTKTDLVLRDELDPLLDAAFAAQPPELSTVQAMVGAMREVVKHLSRDEVDGVKERAQLFWGVPELRAAALGQLMDAMEQVARLAAARTGRDVVDPQIRALSGAVVGASIAALAGVADDPAADIFEVAASYLDHIEAALRL